MHFGNTITFYSGISFHVLLVFLPKERSRCTEGDKGIP
jgi:hypothetical protein